MNYRETTIVLKWSARLKIRSRPSLPGDKINLPASALESLLSAASDEAINDPSSRNLPQARQHAELPQPLTFRVVNPANDRVMYCGVQEFSEEEDYIGFNSLLLDALGIKNDLKSSDDKSKDEITPRTITIHYEALKKGSYVKLRPLEAGYDVEDWKALLERHLRANFTTLTKGEVLEVPLAIIDRSSISGDACYKFLVDELRPEDKAVCIVDTDLEVDIEALDENQARETVKILAEKHNVKHTGADKVIAQGGELTFFKDFRGTVREGGYVDYQLSSWPRQQVIDFELSTLDFNDVGLNILVSPYSSRQRGLPRTEDYLLGNWEDESVKRIRIMPTNTEFEHAEQIYISIHASEAQSSDNTAKEYTLQLRCPADVEMNALTTSSQSQHAASPGDVQCTNCMQWIPQQTIMLHENFCRRNNVLCPQGCGQVFQRSSEAFDRHWHCDKDTFYGNGKASLSKHNNLYHPKEPFRCTRCFTTQTFSSVPLLAQHHVTVCPAKIILCQFCHLNVAQEGDADIPNVEALLSDLTVHELRDGSRTTECHLCGKIARLRDMSTHMKYHNLERKTCPRPRPCRNTNCGNTLDGTTSSGNTRSKPVQNDNYGLCSDCYGPLYVSLYDPEGKALKRRIERRYLQQLMTGCNRSWCHNEFCKSGRTNTGRAEQGASTKSAISLVKPFVDASVIDMNVPLHFCVGETCQKRRDVALALEAEMVLRNGQVKAYTFPWCLGAIEAENGDFDKARIWLEGFAPRKDEEREI